MREIGLVVPSMEPPLSLVPQRPVTCNNFDLLHGIYPTLPQMPILAPSLNVKVPSAWQNPC